MRALVSVVVLMGVLIVAGIAVIGITIARRMGGPAVVANLTLSEPDGTHIAGIASAADRLGLLLQGGGPDRVVLVDPKSGQVVARMGLAR